MVRLLTAALLTWTMSSAFSLVVPPPLDAIATGYGIALAAHPLVTKSATNAVISGLGDALAQKRGNDGVFDVERNKNYVLLGLGSGVAWSSWYDVCDQASNSLVHGSSGLECAARTALSILGEQFCFAPMVFGLWVVPAGTMLNGGRLGDVPGEVQSKLPEMLLLQAKVWTLANIIIYNSPLPVRLLASNTVDLVWASLLSRVVASCGADLGEESCAAPSAAAAPVRVPAAARPAGGAVGRVAA